MKPTGSRKRLIAYVSGAARTPFEWGRHDCALFAAGAVKAQTGKDPACGLRGQYRTAAGAMKHLRKLGYTSLGDLIGAQFREVSPAFAQVGDLAVVHDDMATEALGVVQGERIYVLRPDGLGLVPLTEARRAFRV